MRRSSICVLISAHALTPVGPALADPPYPFTTGVLNYQPNNLADYYKEIGWDDPDNILLAVDSDQLALGNSDGNTTAYVELSFLSLATDGPGADVAIWYGWYEPPPGGGEEGVEGFTLYVSHNGKDWFLAAQVGHEEDYEGMPPKAREIDISPAGLPKVAFMRIEAPMDRDLEINAVELLHPVCA